VAELNTASSDQRPSIRFDGLELVFASDRASTLGGLDLWGTTRSTPSQSWVPPVNLGAVVNSAATDTQPFLSPDRETLLFASDRAGGAGSFDLYVATRAKTRGR
jgi:Tol biopolymer transport system component